MMIKEVIGHYNKQVCNGKVYITVEKADGASEQMEVILAFKLEESGKDYKNSVIN